MHTYIQIRHKQWEEAPGCQEWGDTSLPCTLGYFYSNYLHVDSWVVNKTRPYTKVRKGQLIGYTGRDKYSNFGHLHFEIRAGRAYQKYCCNPWKYLPNAANTYESFTANIDLDPNHSNEQNKASVVVTVSVPSDQLTLNRIELYISTHSTFVKRTFTTQ